MLMNKTSINQKVKDMKPEVGFICYSIAIQNKTKQKKKQKNNKPWFYHFILLSQRYFLV